MYDLGYGIILKFGFIDCHYFKINDKLRQSERSDATNGFNESTENLFDINNHSDINTQNHSHGRPVSVEYSSNREWTRQYMILYEYNGFGRMYIFDPISWVPIALIHLRDVSQVT